MPRVRYEGEAVTIGKKGHIRPQGQGTITYLDGDLADYRYEGDFLGDGNGHPHGQGRFYRPDGTLEYEGEWQEDKYHGSGRLSYFEDTYPDYAGYRYEGDFIKGMCHGQGSFYRPDGTLEYEGEWQEDDCHGHGKSYHDDGTTIEYEGDFVEGMCHGQGTLYNPDGSVRRRGRWANGKPVDDPEP